MKIEIINTGTELLIGDVINTNVAWLGQRLVELGVQIERSVCVPDGQAIEEALRESCQRANIVIVTGGLGPTSDDVSREGAAAVFGLDLELDEASMQMLTDYFAARGSGVNEHNRRQAMKPTGAVVLSNPNGTAPGLYLPASLGVEHGVNCHVFLLPGPPRELKPMMVNVVEPLLRGLMPSAVDRACRYFKYTGIGESNISIVLQPELEVIPGLETGYCIGKGDVDVRLSGPASAVEIGSQICRQHLGEYLVSEDRRVLEEVVVSLLNERSQVLALAESCTGGAIASRITDVSGASRVFGYGLVTYANEAKSQLLGVPEALISEHGAVSYHVAAAMATGCLKVSGADHAVAVTGIAGPDGGSEDKPVGTVYIALASKGHEVEVRKRWYNGERARFKMLTSQTALDFVRRRLCGYGLPNA